jgi:hypothetical protein
LEIAQLEQEMLRETKSLEEAPTKP